MFVVLISLSIKGTSSEYTYISVITFVVMYINVPDTTLIKNITSTTRYIKPRLNLDTLNSKLILWNIQISNIKWERLYLKCYIKIYFSSK